jgi:hypothetical protein
MLNCIMWRECGASCGVAHASVQNIIQIYYCLFLFAIYLATLSESQNIRKDSEGWNGNDVQESSHGLMLVYLEIYVKWLSKTTKNFI